MSSGFSENENNDGVDDRQYQVVRNDEDQYSIWLVELEIPDGWEIVGDAGSRSDCLQWIEEHWTDMRPKSLRQALDDGSGDRKLDSLAS